MTDILGNPQSKPQVTQLAAVALHLYGESYVDPSISPSAKNKGDMPGSNAVMFNMLDLFKRDPE